MKTFELSDKDGKAEYRVVSGNYTMRFEINYNLTVPSILYKDHELSDLAFHCDAWREAHKKIAEHKGILEKNKIRQKINEQNGN